MKGEQTMKYYYKALFAKEVDGGFTVTFPDVEEVVTYGDTLEEAVAMAKECLGMCLETREEEGLEIPRATEDNLECPQDCFFMLIEFDMIEYKRKYNKKSIRKNVTIPAWLNDLAEASNVNFSNVLQNALMKQLDLK